MSEQAYAGGVFSYGDLSAWTYDPVAGLFYLATSDGVIQALDPSDSLFRTIGYVGNDVQGLAVTADGSGLYVGLAGGTPNGSGSLETMGLLSFTTGDLVSQTLAGAFQGGGPANIVITPSGEGFFSESIQGSGWSPLYMFSTASAFSPTALPGIWSAGNDVPPIYFYAPMLSLSSNGQYLAVADVANSDGSVGLFNAQTGAQIARTDFFTLFPGGGGGESYKIAVSNAGAIADVIPGGEVIVLNTSLGIAHEINSPASDQIVGAAYNVDGSILYLWDNTTQALDAYSTTTLQQVASYAVDSTAVWPFANASNAGAMTLADNGRLMLLDDGAPIGGGSGGGFEIVDLRPGEHREDFHGDGLSDFLLENTSGQVATGEVASGVAGITDISTLGPDWNIVATGDFLGVGKSAFLVENGSGALAVGEVGHGTTTYEQVYALDSTWSFVGAGDLLGDGVSQVLVENTNGLVALGEIVEGQEAFSLVSDIGPDWRFHGVGDFVGDGKAQFLLENTAGALVLGEVTNGAAAYTFFGMLGAEWNFVGTGDFLGDGKDDYMVENAAGAVWVGEVTNGVPTYTELTSGLSQDWRFVGTGDYLGEGHEQFLIENSAGAVTVGDWTGGQLHFTQVATLGPEWNFH